MHYDIAEVKTDAIMNEFQKLKSIGIIRRVCIGPKVETINERRENLSNYIFHSMSVLDKQNV